MLRPGQPQIFPADGFVAALPVLTAEPAALVAQELHLGLLRPAQGGKGIKGPVQAEIRHHIAKLLPFQLAPQLRKLRQHLCGGRDQIKIRITLLQVCLLYTSGHRDGEGNGGQITFDHLQVAVAQIVPHGELRQKRKPAAVFQHVHNAVGAFQAVSYTHLDVYKRQG